MELLRPLADSNYPAASATTGATAVTLGPWPAGAQGVMVWCTEDAYISVNGTATSASTPIPNNVPIPFYAPQTGNSAPWTVSALQISAAGTVYAKPINIR